MECFSQLMFLGDRILSRRPPLTMEVKLKVKLRPKLRNVLKQNYKLCQILMRNLFLELCVSWPLFLALNQWLNVYFKANLQYLPLVMASNFDGQIDYLEQFGTNNVSHFLHVSSNCWTVVCPKIFYYFFTV